jgi:hypothetical protein
MFKKKKKKTEKEKKTAGPASEAVQAYLQH